MVVARIGSELSWQAAMNLGRNTSERLSLDFGYSTLEIDYEKGEGVNRFFYDVRTEGPQIGAAWHF